ncbi:MAG: succinate dehydrogenase, hydrophobic membrane anchor protein [Pseudomonadota bacterium]
MGYITDRKRAAGLGSAKAGTEHHWAMTVTSVALAVLTPLFLLSFGSILGASYEAVQTHYAHPYHALVAALFLGVGCIHFKNGVRVLIEDYVHGLAREAAIIAMTCVSYALFAVALFALARLAL